MRSEYEKAVPHYERAWALRSAHREPEEMDHWIAKRDYANCLSKIGRGEEALPLLREVLAVQRRTLPPDDGYTSMTISLIGGTLMDLGRLEDAEPFLREGYERRRRSWGERHGNTLTSMNNLGSLYHRLGRHDDALALFERLVVIREQVDGRTHPRTLIARGNHATALTHLGRVGEGIDRLEAVRTDQLEVIGPTHGHTLHVLRKLIQLHEQQGDGPRATELCSALVDACRQRYGDDDQRTRDAIGKLAEVRAR